MCIVTLASVVFLSVPAASESKPIAIPDWQGPAKGNRQPFRIGVDARQVNIWGRGAKPERVYFDEFLPALFERTLLLDTLDLQGGALEWIFTGDRGGFTVSIDDKAVRLSQRFYDSGGLHDPKIRTRHPEKTWRSATARYTGTLRAVSVVLDHKLGLALLLNGKQILHQVCQLDVSRHQLCVTSPRANVVGSLARPAPANAVVRIDPAKQHQTMIGFGGIATPTAYALLSPEGKRRWWEIVSEYNLLIQREYPIGTRLNPAMDNWDRLEDATPHYYGDNFPNGEISDFAYIKTLRRLGGKVWFEFWALPPWATVEQKDGKGKARRVADPEVYAKAMVNYCETFRKKTGGSPDVLGIQNERTQPPAIWHRMTLTLRRELDRAGFGAVKIHMSDHSHLSGGINNAKAFRSSEAAWAAIDYAATHMYDYQSFFTEPDGYDERLAQWRQLTAEKPFLSTELCINKDIYQRPSYRIALVMGQLYHKNLTITDAAAICYCWTILNVVQPSYGWTRTLFVPDKSHGFIPVPSSCQLRVFGAYSRRIREGMVRIDAKTAAPDILVSAFAADGKTATVVILNRSTIPHTVRVEGAGGRFQDVELVDPYHENTPQTAPAPDADGSTEVLVPGGGVVTLSSVRLGKLPDNFRIERN